MRRAALISLLVLALSGCGFSKSTARPAIVRVRNAAPACPAQAAAGWHRLAVRIRSAVYCPAWMPGPLDGVIGGRWNNIDSISPDRSYLIGFVWQEPQSGEIHVNLRGYPGRTAIPRCPGPISGSAQTIPCFDSPNALVHENGITATAYTVNQGADQWHVLYAWRRRGTLYTLSQHVALPLSYTKVVADLKRMLRTLVLVRP